MRDQFSSTMSTLQQRSPQSQKPRAKAKKKPSPRRGDSSNTSALPPVAQKRPARKKVLKEPDRLSLPILSRLLLPLTTTAERKTTTVVYDGRVDVPISPGDKQLVLYAHLGRSPFGLFRIFRGSSIDPTMMNSLLSYNNHFVSEDCSLYEDPTLGWIPLVLPPTGGVYRASTYPPVTEGLFGRAVGAFVEIFVTVPQGARITLYCKMMDEDEVHSALSQTAVYNPHNGTRRHRLATPGKHRIVLPMLVRDKPTISTFSSVVTAGGVNPSSAGFYDWLIWTGEEYFSLASMHAGDTAVALTGLPLQVEVIQRHAVQYIATGYHHDVLPQGRTAEHALAEAHSACKEAGKTGAEMLAGAAAATAAPRLGGALSAAASNVGTYLGGLAAEGGTAAAEAAAGALAGVEMTAPIFGALA